VVAVPVDDALEEEASADCSNDSETGDPGVAEALDVAEQEVDEGTAEDSACGECDKIGKQVLSSLLFHDKWCRTHQRKQGYTYHRSHSRQLVHG